MIEAPKPYPCASCPYRADVPSGVWSEDEYRKLPEYDRDTGYQPPSVFMCHQEDERLCSGWVGCHDMNESMGLRMAISLDRMSEEVARAALTYISPVPLFASGAEAAEHGLASIENPPEEAARIVSKIKRRRQRRA